MEFLSESYIRGQQAAAEVIKSSAALSEVVGTLTMPYSKKEQKEADKAGISNFIPGVGGYQLGKRLRRKDQ